jgi:hypothetical protein
MDPLTCIVVFFGLAVGIGVVSILVPSDEKKTQKNYFDKNYFDK